MDNKQSYKENAFNPKELRKEWNSIMHDAGEAKKRYTEQEKFFQLFHNSHLLFLEKANALLPHDREAVKPEVKEAKVIPMKQKYKKGEKHVHHQLDQKSEIMELKMVPEEEISYDNLLKYIAITVTTVENGKQGLDRMVKRFKTYIDEVDDKKNNSGYKVLINTLEKIELTKHKPENLAYYRAGKTMFVNTLKSSAHLLDLSQLANDEILTNTATDAMLFNMLNDMMNTTYAVILKYFVAIMEHYTLDIDDEEGKKLDNGLQAIIEGNKLIQGYRWHIQEINANAIQMMLVITKIQNYKSKLFCIHALFLENLFGESV